jgi:lipoprotein-anchoring transpeptidase ErfK/SrfK
MQHRVSLVLLTGLVTVGTASAGPLNLNPERYAEPAGAYAAAPPPPAAVRQAAAQDFGGGFIEMLFGGPSRESSPPGYYQAPQAAPEMRSPMYRQEQEDAPLLGPATGNPNAQINPRFLKQQVSYDGAEPAGTIIINTNERLLYLVEGPGRALRYGIGVGRPGFAWAGVHHVTNKREWPDWTPPDDMLKRRPDLPRHMEGGPDNPLGARAMYLGSTLYRIHGSNEPWTIGQAVSSGCIRMRNEDVIDLYGRVKVGTKVVVI